VLGADLGGGEEAEKGRTLCGCLDRRAAVGLFTLDQADHGGNAHSRLAGGFDGVDGRGAGGAHVIHDDHARASTAEALDAAAGAVRLLGLAHEEALEHLRFGLAALNCLDGAPSSGDGNRRNDGVRAHGQSADGLGLNAAPFEQINNGLAGVPAALGVEGGRPAVDVVVAGAARGEFELAQAEALAGKNGEQLLRVVITVDCKG